MFKKRKKEKRDSFLKEELLRKLRNMPSEVVIRNGKAC